MLSSILPGLRDLRAPLTAGSIVLASVYVLLEKSAGQATAEDNLGPGLLALRERIGERGWLIVAGVAAYLLGSIFMSARSVLVRAGAMKLVPHVATDDYLSRKQLRWEAIVAPFSRPSLRRLGLLRETEHDPELVYAVCRDIMFGGGKRLLVANKELYGEYDRLSAEAEFRDAVTLPGLILLAIVLANIQGAVAVEVIVMMIGVAIGVVLTAQARGLDRQANSMYAHAVADGVVSTAALDNLDKDRPKPAVRSPHGQLGQAAGLDGD